MARALQVCSQPGCPSLTPTGRCEDCRSEAERQRGSAHQRGYGGKAWNTSRRVVLARDPLCVCADDGHGHDGRQCGEASTVSDHWPHERRDLVAAGVPDPDAPHRMRGCCAHCHNRKTGATRPGGWAAQNDLGR